MGLCFSKETGAPGEGDGAYVTPDMVSPQYYYSGILRLSSFRSGGTSTGVQFLLESPRMSSIALDSPRVSLASGDFRLAGGSPRFSADVGDTGTLNALLNRSRQTRGMQLQGPSTVEGPDQDHEQEQGRAGKGSQQSVGAGSGRTVYSAELSSSQRLAATNILTFSDSHSKKHCICCTDCGSRKLAKCRDCGSHKLSVCPMCDNRIPRCGECRFGRPLSCGACGSTRLASSLQIEAGKINCGVCGAAMLASCDRCSTRFKRTTCGQCGRASTDTESREELEEFSEFGLDQSGGEMDSSVEFLELTAGVFEMRRKPPHPSSRSRLQQPRMQQKQQHQPAELVTPLPSVVLEEPAAVPLPHPEIAPSPSPTPAAAATVSGDENLSSTFASPTARSGIQEEVDMELATPDGNHSLGGGEDFELDGREGQDSMSSTEGQILENGQAEGLQEEFSSSPVEESAPEADTSLEVDDAPAALSTDQGHHMRNISFGMCVPDVPASSAAAPADSGGSSGSGGSATNRQQLLNQVLYGDVSFSSFLTGSGMAATTTLSGSLDDLTLQEFSQQFENVAKTYAEAAAMAAARDAFGFREENDASLTFPRLFETQAQAGGSTPEVGQWQVPFLSLESDLVPGSADQAAEKTTDGADPLVKDVSQQQSVMFTGRAQDSAWASDSGAATKVSAGPGGSVHEIEAGDEQEQRRSKIMDRMEERFIKAQLHTHGFLLDSLTKEEFADQLRLRHAALRSKVANVGAGSGGAMAGAGEKITRNLQRKSAEFSRTSTKEVAGSEIESETEVVADRKWKGKGKEFEDLLFPGRCKQQGHAAVVADSLFPGKQKQQGDGAAVKGKEKVVMPDSIPVSLQEKVWATERAFNKRKEEIQSIWEEAEREREDGKFNRAAFIESWKASSSKMPSSYPQPISLSSPGVRYGNGSESEPHRLSTLKDESRKAGPGGPGKPPMKVSWGYVVREPRSRSFEEARPRYLTFGDDVGRKRRYSLESHANVMVRDSDLKSCLKKSSASDAAVPSSSKEPWYPATGRPGRVPLTFPGGMPGPAPPAYKGESYRPSASREIPVPAKNRRHSGESFKYESLAAFSMVQDYDSDASSVSGRPVAAPEQHNVNGSHHRLRHAPTVMLDCAGQFGRSGCRGMSSVETRNQVFGGAPHHGHGHASHSHSRSEARGTRKSGYGVSGEDRDVGFSRGRESPEHVSVQDLCDVLVTEHPAPYCDRIPPELPRRRRSEEMKRWSVSSTAAFPDRIIQEEGYGMSLGSETAPLCDRLSPDHRSSRSHSSESEPTTLRRSLSSGRMSAMGVESSASGLRALGALGVMEEEIEQFLGASPIHSKSTRKAEVQRKVNQITSLAHLKKQQQRPDDGTDSPDNWELRRGTSSVMTDDLRFREEEAAASLVESRKAAALAGATAYNEVGSPSSTIEEEVEKFVIADMDEMGFNPSNVHGSEKVEQEAPIPQPQLPRNRTTSSTGDGLPEWLGTVGYGSAFGSPLDPVTPSRSDVFGGGDKAGQDQRKTFQGTITYGLPTFYSSEKERNGASRSYSGRYTVSFIDPKGRAAAAAAQEQRCQQQQQQRLQRYRRPAAAASGKANDSEDDGESSSDLFEIESLAGTDSATGASPRPQDKHRRQSVDRGCEVIDVSMFEEFAEASPLSVTVSLNSMECFNGSDMNLSINLSEDETDDVLVYQRVSAQGVPSHMDGDDNSEEEETTTERESERDFYRHARDRDEAYRWSSSLSGSSDMSHLHPHPGGARHGLSSPRLQTHQDLAQHLLKSAHNRRKDFYGGTLARLGIRDPSLPRPPMSVSRDSDLGELLPPANGITGINGINGNGIPDSGALFEARKHLLRGRSRQVHNCRLGPGPGAVPGPRSRRHLTARR